MIAADKLQCFIAHRLRIYGYARCAALLDDAKLFSCYRIRPSGFNRELRAGCNIIGLLCKIQKIAQLVYGQHGGRSAAEIQRTNIQPEFANHLRTVCNIRLQSGKIGLHVRLCRAEP